jgi:hypothetical protein
MVKSLQSFHASCMGDSLMTFEMAKINWGNSRGVLKDSAISQLELI